MLSIIAKLQDRAAALLGLDPARRTPLVRSMLQRPRGDAAGYWLQLVISAALATLGLALDSTAVVIGAMLIAPLMRPIVELAMGLATGSMPLVFGAGVRAVASIVVGVGSAAAITWLLPFHEVTPELLARTAPSLLDLCVAAACAVAGAYAVVITTSDVATTAAGTAIGISLVPPLCTAGYGVSIGDWEMAIGAGLLFTANVTGIITFASALFVIVGFGQVNVREEERSLDDVANIGAATRFGRRVSRRSSRLGLTARVLTPLVLLAAVAFPLGRAVDTMARRSSVRQRVAEVMGEMRTERVVHYALDQAARPITLRVVVVGEPASARRLEEHLRAELAAVGEPAAAVSVWAVPDARAVSALAARLDDVPAVVPVAPPPPPPAPPPSLEARIRAAWPASRGGQLLSVWTSEGTPPRVRISHLGPALGPAACEILAAAVAVGEPPIIEEDALGVIEHDASDTGAWAQRAVAALGRASELAHVNYCVSMPPVRPSRRRNDPADALVRAAVTRAAAEATNVHVMAADRWRIVPQLEPCTPPAAAASP